MDEVLCDMVPMQASHILLMRPWQCDRQVTHDGVTNRYHFSCKDQKITLVPLTPRQVHEDQMSIQRQLGGERDKKKKESESKMKTKEGVEKKKGESKEKEHICLLAHERDMRNFEEGERKMILILYREALHIDYSVTHSLSSPSLLCLYCRIIRTSYQMSKRVAFLL